GAARPRLLGLGCDRRAGGGREEAAAEGAPEVVPGGDPRLRLRPDGIAIAGHVAAVEEPAADGLQRRLGMKLDRPRPLAEAKRLVAAWPGDQHLRLLGTS